MAIVDTLGRIVPYLRKPKQGYEGNKDSDGNMHGRGILHYGSGNVYEGLFENGLRHGQGKLCCSNGDEYDGQWQHDKRHGRGSFIGADGSDYEGKVRSHSFVYAFPHTSAFAFSFSFLYILQCRCFCFWQMNADDYFHIF